MSRIILMLEHDEDDQYISRSYFEGNKYDVKLEFVTNAQDFWFYLNSTDLQPDKSPSVILLNYHAKPHTAIPILRDLKNDARLRHIPVIVLSGWMTQEIVDECYAAGANSFIQKPSTNAKTVEKINSFIDYWFGTASLAHPAKVKL